MATSARLRSLELVTRGAAVSGLDAVEIEPDRWVLQYGGQPPVVGPMSLGELVLYVLEDFVIQEEFAVFGQATKPVSSPPMLQHLMSGVMREEGCDV